ncbi:hypothetical protein [Fodinibius saliphilus]|uniref:hypothetical protein n=1 Tax=Fodinibius saliphilus TaxID=1920650 RepID=UPI001109AB4F|nr:hypothetical protein [Fodinibius saliphilus]
MNILEFLRKDVVANCYKTKSFSNAWEIWGKLIKQKLGKNYNWDDILNLGEELSEVFLSTRGDVEEGLSVAEANSKASTSGTAWECLVAWYLNLVFVNSRAVVFKKTGDVPTPLTDGLEVLHKNTKTNSESDLLVVVFPDTPHFTDEILQVPITNERSVPYVPDKNMRPANLFSDSYPDKSSIQAYVDKVTEEKIDEFEVGVIQCKTNWNENSQIPMLWDIIYRLGDNVDQDIPNFKIGANGFSKMQLKKFTYSFVTVPTNPRANYKATSLAVNRVKNLTGGNYWGFPRKQSVAGSIKEIFDNNFMNAFDGSIRESLQGALHNDLNSFEYFRLD